jgi:hypothetical protein
VSGKVLERKGGQSRTGEKKNKTIETETERRGKPTEQGGVDGRMNK